MIGAFIAWSDQSNSPGYVIDGNGCHIWVGSTVSDTGYGKVTVDGRQVLVHRERYEREIGPIPDGMILDHHCNHGHLGCCNPLHTRLATRRENTLRGDTLASANAAKTHCNRGHPLSGDNLLSWSNGKRGCRTCCRERTRAYRLSKKAA